MGVAEQSSSDGKGGIEHSLFPSLNVFRGSLSSRNHYQQGCENRAVKTDILLSQLLYISIWDQLTSSARKPALGRSGTTSRRGAHWSDTITPNLSRGRREPPLAHRMIRISVV
jgi:hypothetical protein